MKRVKKEWQRGFERFFKDREKEEVELQFGEWGIEDFKDFVSLKFATYKIEYDTKEQFDRAKAMIEFCTNYENESFELFYKWFVKNRKEG